MLPACSTASLAVPICFLSAEAMAAPLTAGILTAKPRVAGAGRLPRWYRATADDDPLAPPPRPPPLDRRPVVLPSPVHADGRGRRDGAPPERLLLLLGATGASLSSSQESPPMLSASSPSSS